MRVLFITNTGSTRCGVKAFGEEWVASLRRLGVEVDVWDGTYTAVKAADRWIPENAASYDVIHFNWDPQTINHYLPQHFDGLEEKLSLFLHDVPPNSTCPVHGIARWVWGFEPGDRIQVLPEPVPPAPEDLPAPIRDPITIGVSGVRQDPGHFEVGALCKSRGWALNAPGWWTGPTAADLQAGAWLTNADEIRRLARSTVNVCWYHTSGRGKSMAAMFCVAAGRPLVLSPSTMFSALADYGSRQGIFHSPSTTILALDRLLDQALQSGPPIAALVQRDLGWDHVLQPVLTAWRRA
jgi:hypothetical protein